VRSRGPGFIGPCDLCSLLARPEPFVEDLGAPLEMRSRRFRVFWFLTPVKLSFRSYLSAMFSPLIYPFLPLLSAFFLALNSLAELQMYSRSVLVREPDCDGSGAVVSPVPVRCTAS